MNAINDKTCVPSTAERRRSDLIRLALILAAFAAVYAPTVPLLLSTWRSPDFSHGIIVPFVSAYLIWDRRDALKMLPFEPSWVPGIIVTLAGIIMLLLGITGSVVVVEEASIIVMVPGLILLLLGTRHLRAMALPIGYLILMVPVLTPFLEAIYWPLQLVTAKLAGLMLSAVGVPVYHNNQFLELPNISLEVAQECSGAQFLISVFAIAIPLACISLRGRNAKIALFALAFLITIFSNALRVTLIGFLAYVYDKKSALHGPYHILTGYFVFMVGFVFLFLSTWVIGRFSGKAPEEKRVTEPSCVPPLESAGSKRAFRKAWAAALVILIGAGTFIYTYKATPVSLEKPLSELPMSIGRWSGDNTAAPPDTLRIPGADYEAARVYRNPDGKTVDLYIAYFTSQTQGRELINVKFSDLYSKIEQVDLTLGSGARMSVNKAVIREGSRDFLVLFWYDLNGRIIANRNNAKLQTAVGGLIHRRTNGAVVMLKSPMPAANESQKFLDDEKEFISHLQPVLRDWLRQG